MPPLSFGFSVGGSYPYVAPADVTAPGIASAVVPANGLSLILTYDEALDASSVPSTAAYSVAGIAGSVSGVNVTGSTVVLTISVAIDNDDVPTVTYVVPGSGKVRDAAGNNAVALTARAVINNSTVTPADVTAPTLVSAAINAAGTSLTLTYNEALDTGSVPATGAYALSGAALAAITAVNVVGSTVVLTLSPAALESDTITLGYTPGGSRVRDLAANNAAALAAQSVANGSTVALPQTISGLVFWASADHTTDAGNGTTVTAQSDRSSTGAAFGEASAGIGPIRRDATGRRRRVVDYSIGKKAISTNAVLTALGSGVPKDFTVVTVYQSNGNSLSYQWGWGSTTLGTRYNYERRNTTFVDEIQQRDPTNNNTAVAISQGVQHLSPQVNIVIQDAAANQVRKRIDGVAQTPATLNRASTTMDVFGIGSNLRQGSEVLSCQKFERHLLVYNRKLTTDECEQIEEWAAGQFGTVGVGLGYKIPTLAPAFGNGSGAWIVIAMLGQSNNAGRGLSSTYVSTHAGTSQAGWCLYADMHLAEVADPTADPTNAPGSTIADAASEPAASYAVRMVDRLRAAGETRNIMVVNCSVGATASSTWASGATTSPPAVTTLTGAAKHRIAEALKVPNAELMITMWQGEADAATSVANYVSNWTTVFNELNTYFAAYLTKTKHFFVVQSPSAYWTGTTTTLWDALRAAQASLVSGRSDAVLVPAPAAGPFTSASNLHVDTGSNAPGAETGLMKVGIDMANAYLAAT